ncbi:Ribosomal protein L35 [Euphorbia peplus]|nr:Ribosomal protein L35 [Euphorbia peplus]
MQRFCTKFRSSVQQSIGIRAFSFSRRLHSSPAASTSFNNPLLSSFTSKFQSPSLGFQSPLPSSGTLLSLVQARHVSSRERKKRRKPMTPVVSKVKKVKMKSYSSYKSRFRLMHDGTFRRWREGKRHNAHLKSKKSKRRLRQPSTVPAAYAKVMKKLNFCA